MSRSTASFGSLPALFTMLLVDLRPAWSRISFMPRASASIFAIDGIGFTLGLLTCLFGLCLGFDDGLLLLDLGRHHDVGVLDGTLPLGTGSFGAFLRLVGLFQGLGLLHFLRSGGTRKASASRSRRSASKLATSMRDLFSPCTASGVRLGVLDPRITVRLHLADALVPFRLCDQYLLVLQGDRHFGVAVAHHFGHFDVAHPSPPRSFRCRPCAPCPPHGPSPR